MSRIISKTTEEIIREIYQVEYDGNEYTLTYLSDKNDVYDGYLRNKKGEDISEPDLFEAIEEFVNDIIRPFTFSKTFLTTLQ